MPQHREDARPVVTHGAVLFLGSEFKAAHPNPGQQFLIRHDHRRVQITPNTGLLACCCKSRQSCG